MTGRPSLGTQANALARKNLTYQKRRKCDNCCLLLTPVILLALLKVVQVYVDSQIKETTKPGANKLQDCVNPYAPPFMADACDIQIPPELPPRLEIPYSRERAVYTDFMPYADLPDKSCRKTDSCPVTFLVTSTNQSVGQSLARNMFPGAVKNSSDISVDEQVLGSSGSSSFSQGFSLQANCSSNASYSIPWKMATRQQSLETRCLQSLALWRNSSSDINDELYKGNPLGNAQGEVNEFAAGYDFSTSDDKSFSVIIWYNPIKRFNILTSQTWLKVPRLVNLASNAYLQFLRGTSTKTSLKFIKKTPQHGRKVLEGAESLTNFIGPPGFLIIVLTLFPIILKFLVYEKQQNTRIMMKMHGLGDGAYWIITYTYLLFLSLLSMFFFVGCGSVLGLPYFRMNDYSIQFVFYFLYMNLQLSFAFLAANFFKTVRTASVVGNLFLAGTCLTALFLFSQMLNTSSVEHKWVVAAEFFPGFSLYRGLNEFAMSASADGMQWEDLNGRSSGMKEVLIIMLIEWPLLIFLAYYLDQVVSSGSGVKKSPLFFLPFCKKPSREGNIKSHGSDQGQGQMEKPDVKQEREKVEHLMLESISDHAIVCHNMRKVYPARDGNPEKVAVKGLSLALPQAECFGMLGPNGAGKTSFISMMIGLTQPTSGTAYVRGLDIRTSMDDVYTSMGVCPQFDLLWGCLTGREHLLFYGRLKNLKGRALTQAVEESLISLNLFYGGVADKQADKYSGGMKRRLSVAISLIGNPKVVYMDEPSTGLDPAARNNLWNVVKRAKQDRAIILTTHSMEEADALCDRVGIFVDGSLQCIGNTNELKARYGGTYVFTMTTSAEHDALVEDTVMQLCPNAKKIYHLAGTQKFELPKHEVGITDVFETVENAKNMFPIHAWGLADTTLEEVFIKVAREVESSSNADRLVDSFIED